MKYVLNIFELCDNIHIKQLLTFFIIVNINNFFIINLRKRISKNKHYYFNTMLFILRKLRIIIAIISIIFIINKNSLTIVYSNFIFNAIFETMKFFIINIIKREIKR